MPEFLQQNYLEVLALETNSKTLLLRSDICNEECKLL